MVGDDAPGLRDHRERALVVERALHDDDVVGHLEHHAVVGAARHVPDALGHLVALHGAVHPAGLAHRVRRRDVERHVHLDVGHREVEGGEAAVPLGDAGGELDRPELAIVRVGDLHRHVAHHRVRHARLHLLEQPLRVEEPARGVEPRDRERDGTVRDGRAAGQGRLEEAVRGRPQLHLPLGEGDGRGDGQVVHHVPGVSPLAKKAWRSSPRMGCPPPPRGGFSAWVRTKMSRIDALS